MENHDEIAELRAELEKLIRWHGEDDAALARARAEITRLRGELATARERSAADLTADERQFLTFALNQAAEEMSLHDGFTAEDSAALKRLRRMAGETQPAACSCAVLRTGPGRHFPECPNRPAAGARQDGAES